MPATIKFQVKSNVKLVTRGKEHLKKKVPEIARLRLYHAALDLKKRMSVRIRHVGYPVPWDNDRQRIKVIIMLKRRHNIPYQQTHEAEKSWYLIKTARGYNVASDMRQVRYLYGNAKGRFQSNIHSGRRPLLYRQARIVINGLPKTVVAAMKQVAAEMPKAESVK